MIGEGPDDASHELWMLLGARANWVLKTCWIGAEEYQKDFRLFREELLTWDMIRSPRTGDASNILIQSTWYLWSHYDLLDVIWNAWDKKRHLLVFTKTSNLPILSKLSEGIKKLLTLSHQEGICNQKCNILLLIFLGKIQIWLLTHWSNSSLWSLLSGSMRCPTKNASHPKTISLLR